MALLGISLIVASVVYVIIRPPSWLLRLPLFQFSRAIQDDTSNQRDEQQRQNGDATLRRRDKANTEPPGPSISVTDGDAPPSNKSPDIDRQMMPPPPLPRRSSSASSVSPPRIQEPDSPTTPKAKATHPPTLSSPPPPSFSLSTVPPPPPPPPPANTAASAMMPPPPRPNPPSSSRPPTLSQFPAVNSAQRARGPAPSRLLPPGSSRIPAAGASSLAPPPTHSSKPAKPSRQVQLDPGHSPLDWARISGGNADLRGVPSSTPYLRVTPSMLKKQTGRKGKDAWMVLNGKVYNVTPYAPFHPGGVPEMMRGAGRDGTKLFGEIHPWVNYETMLSACLVGLLVEEPVAGVSGESEMDQMD